MRIEEIAAAGSPKSKMIYHENPEMLHVNTLARHSYFIPFAKGQDPFAKREESESLELLNGDWSFRYFDSICRSCWILIVNIFSALKETKMLDM